MENSQSIKTFYKNYSFVLLFFIFIIVVITTISIVFAYSPYYTHPDLTEEIAKLWNLKNNNQNLEISQNEIRWMREGAINEDAPPRWINHFYNPIDKAGWSGKHFGTLSQEEGLYQGESMAPKSAIASIDWVTNQEYQSAYGRQYGNQTWQRAIKSYIDGDKKSAFIALGHILHLIEDVSVPDHTRDDTHADLYGDPGSPYEKYSKEYTNFNKLNIAENLKNKELFNFLTIQSAFEYLANYSNNNFFSEDTINNEEFDLPNIEKLESRTENIDNKKYLFLYDQQKQAYIALLKENNKYSIDNKSFILSSYFNNLAPQAVLTGASVLNLFFQDIEKYKNNPELLPEIVPDSSEPILSYLRKSPRLAAVDAADKCDKIITDYQINGEIINLGKEVGCSTVLGAAEIIDETTTNIKIAYKYSKDTVSNITNKIIISSQIYFAQISDSFSGVFNNDNFQSVGEISLNQASGVRPQTANQSSRQSAPQASIKQCSFATSQSPSRLKIIINEVAWMGGVNSADDEWIELKNISNGEFNLSGYQLIDKSGQIKIVFGNNDKIPAGGFELLERTDDNSASGVSADKIYSGALANSNEGLRLFDGNCNLIDEVFANSSWPAGGNETKKTAERGGDFTWHDSAAIGGTPKKENSAPIANKIEQSVQLEKEDNEVVLATQQATSSRQQTQQTQQADNFKQCVFQTNQSPSRQKAVFNEVAWMGGLSDFGLTAADEWIELKNISNNEVDLSGWQILDKSENIKIIFDGAAKIPANGFELLERTDDGSAPNVAADKIYSGTLNNSDEGLRLFDSQCNLIDEVLAASYWPAGDNAQKRTMERSPDFSWYNYNGIAQNDILGTPKKENSSPTIVSSGGGGGAANNQQQTANSTTNSTSSPAKILINEVQIYPTGGRFIELYNPNDFSVNLTDWYIQRKTQTGGGFGSLVSKTYFENKTIGADGYFLISRESLEGADIVLDNLTLTEGNTIQIKNQNGDVIDKVGWGAAGDCESECASELLENQSVQRKFQENNFTDTDNNAQDFEIQTCSSPKTQSRACQSSQTNQALGAFFVNHLIIGEVQIGGDKADDEFIEIYNPTDNAIFLNDYSIQYLSGTATSTENVKKKNFSSGIQIAAKSFYLLVNSSAASSLKDRADMTYSAFSLSGNSSGAAIFLVGATTVISNINDSAIIDSLFYGNSVLTEASATSTIPAPNQSLERKSFASSTPDLMASGEHRFSGNGYDSDNGDDFVLRSLSEPQNSLNFPEPRNAPTAPEKFFIQYSSSMMELVFNWQESQDYSGETSNLIYKISDISGASSTLPATETASTTAKVSINEVGRDYNFSVQAFDKEGLVSEMAASSIFISGFLSNLYFYKDPRASSADYLIEVFYNQYPFIPDLYQGGNNSGWKAMIFYLNGEPAGKIYLDQSFSDFSEWYQWSQETIDKIFKIKYSTCASGGGSPYVFILPDIKENCSVWGGLRNVSFNYNFEDKNFIVSAANSFNDANFTTDDYLTVAYYSFYSSGWWKGLPEVFRLAAIDKTKYYFGEAPIHQPPTAPLNLTAAPDEDFLNLIINWENSVDPDSTDGLIKYELNYALAGEPLDENNWREVSKSFYRTDEKDKNGNDIFIQIGPSISIDIDSGDGYDIYIRAKDEFGNTAVSSITWSPPVFLQ